MLKKEMGVGPDGALDLNKFLAGADPAELKQMLGKEMQKQAQAGKELQYVETGGGSKRRNLRRGTGANSNKMYDFKELFNDGDSD